MAVTIDVDALRRELRVGDSDDETALLTARLAYATEAVTHRAPSAPDAVHNEAAIVLAARLYDKPTTGVGARYAYAGRDSGAWAMLAPYRIHRAGLVGKDAVDAANADGMGTPGNPVTNVVFADSTLTVSYADGSSAEFTIVAGTGDGTDQTARDAAANAATAAGNAQTTADGAATAAGNAQTTADNAATAAGTAQTTADNAGTAAGNAQTRADTANEAAAANAVAIAEAIASLSAGAPSPYLGPYSDLTAGQRAAIEIGNFVLLHNRFWIAHFQTQARTNAPGSGPADGWRPIDGQYRGHATTLARFYDAGDHTVAEGTLYFCETEGSYTAAEIPTSAAWSGGGLDQTKVDARIDLRLITQGPTGVLGTPTQAQYDAGVLQSLGAHTYYVKRSGHTALPSAWTWADLGTDRLAGYRGVTSQNPGRDVADPQTNDWAYDRIGRSWNRYIGTTWAHSNAPANFDPHYADESGAQQGGLVTVGAFIYDVQLDRVRVITAYSGAVPSNLRLQWAAQNPGAGGGGGETPAGPTVLFDAIFATGTTMAKLTGDIVCPASGMIELYCRSLSGDRTGWVGFFRVDAADLRAVNAVTGGAISNSALDRMVAAIGPNRAVAWSTSAAEHFLYFGAQFAGNFKVRIAHHGA